MSSRLAPFAALLLLTACGPSGCGDKPETTERIRVYSSAEECKAEHSAEECAKAFDDAKEAHVKEAPKFAAQSSCEEKYGVGNCVPRHEGSGDVFLPLMTGFLVGHMLGSSPSVVSQPVYLDRSGAAYAGPNPLGSYRSCGPNDSSCSGGRGGGSGYVYGGGTVGKGSGAPSGGIWSRGGSYAPQTVVAPPPSPPAVARGGFGGSASSVTMPAPSAPSIAAAPSGSFSTGVARGGFGGTAATSSASAGE